jgi:hypothetical protein
MKGMLDDVQVLIDEELGEVHGSEESPERKSESETVPEAAAADSSTP